MRTLLVFSFLVLYMSTMFHENHAFSRRFLRKLIRRGMRFNKMSQNQAQQKPLSDEMMSAEESGNNMEDEENQGTMGNNMAAMGSNLGGMGNNMADMGNNWGGMGNNMASMRNSWGGMGNNMAEKGSNWGGMRNNRRNIGNNRRNTRNNNMEAIENMLDETFDMDMEDFMPFYMNFRKYLRWFKRNTFSTTTPSSATKPNGGTTQAFTESSETSAESTEATTEGTTPDMVTYDVTTEKITNPPIKVTTEVYPPTPLPTDKTTAVPAPVTTEVTYPPTPIPTERTTIVPVPVTSEKVTNAPVEITTRGRISTPPPVTVPPTYVPVTVYPVSTQKPVTTTRDRRIDAMGKEPWIPTPEEDERNGGKEIPVVDDGFKTVNDKSYTTKATTAQLRYTTTEAVPTTQTTNLNADDPTVLNGQLAGETNDKVEEKLSLPIPVSREQNFTFLVRPSIPFVTDLTGTKLGIGGSNTEKDEYEEKDANGKTSTDSTTKTATTTSKAENGENYQSKNVEIEKEIEVVTKNPTISSTRRPKTTVFFTTYKYTEDSTPIPAVPASEVPTATTEKPWQVIPGIGETFMEVVPDPVFGAKNTNWVVIPNSGRLNLKENKSVSLNRV